MTGMYNALLKLCSEEEMTAKEKQDHEHGLVSVLRQLHEDLDAAVADAYGWPADLSDADILSELVKLNSLRAAEERTGLIRWIRPEYQNPAGPSGLQTGIPISLEATTQAATDKTKSSWPRALPDQVRSIRDVLDHQPLPQSAEAIARNFRRARTDRVEEILQILEALGQVHQTEGGTYSAG